MKKILIFCAITLNLFAEEAKVPMTGDAAPDAAVRTAEGEAVTLAALTKDTPTVLVFYRGGWCPYCNQHLAGLTEIEAEIQEKGYQIIAISPDRPEKVAEAAENATFKYRLLSDSDMNAAKAYGLAFTLAEDMVTRLQGFGIDVEAASGRDHHMLPVPAVIVIDGDGVIRFRHADEDYTERLSNEALLQSL